MTSDIQGAQSPVQDRESMILGHMAAAGLAISKADREVLRCLAGSVAELAARPVEAEKRELWYRHNALQPTRPLVFCDPENGWNEIIPASELHCTGALARQWEMSLRKELFWGCDMRDDYVIQSFFSIPHVHAGLDWGLKETRIGGTDGGAYRWEAPVRSLADLEKLRFPQVRVDHTTTRVLAEQAQEILGDMLTVRIKSAWWWSLGMATALAHLRGLQQIMLDVVDNPQIIHRMMGFFRDGTLALLDYLEHNHLLSLNNDGTYVGSGGFGWTKALPQADFSGRVRAQDLWGFAESQETVGISPAMFAEFIFPYQLPVLQRFGLNCYGCCEPLDRRWHIVRQIPQLRRVSVSPWADPAKMAEMLGDQYILSLKPAPSALAGPSFDEGAIRADIRHALQITRNCRVEVIMKDNHTIGNDPRRVIRWVQIALEEANGL